MPWPSPNVSSLFLFGLPVACTRYTDFHSFIHLPRPSLFSSSFRRWQQIPPLPHPPINTSSLPLMYLTQHHKSLPLASFSWPCLCAISGRGCRFHPRSLPHPLSPPFLTVPTSPSPSPVPTSATSRTADLFFFLRKIGWARLPTCQSWSKLI